MESVARDTRGNDRGPPHEHYTGAWFLTFKQSIPCCLRFLSSPILVSLWLRHGTTGPSVPVLHNIYSCLRTPYPRRKVALLCLVTGLVSAGVDVLDRNGNQGLPAVHAAPAFEVDAYPKQGQSYEFGYNIDDGAGTIQYHREESDQNNRRQGSYGYHDANGIYREVNYVADEHGFRAWIKTNEPGTSSQHSADVEVTAEQPPAQALKPNGVSDKAVHKDKHQRTARPLVNPPSSGVPQKPVTEVHPVPGVPAPAVAAFPAFHDPAPQKLTKFTLSDAIHVPRRKPLMRETPRVQRVHYIPNYIPITRVVPVVRVPKGLQSFHRQQVPHVYVEDAPIQSSVTYWPFGQQTRQLQPVVTHVTRAVPLYTSVRPFPTLPFDSVSDYISHQRRASAEPQGVTYANSPSGTAPRPTTVSILERVAKVAQSERQGYISNS
ncbi:uncharacterized protein LOC135366875 isoform X2 [Ornithodoros turicata]|uniref:uncharacterized protein LOC135366875 isoform X2 n=1 Tax=Ornithodoros turicata TaxID=34597 RepID=UPI00313A446C